MNLTGTVAVDLQVLVMVGLTLSVILNLALVVTMSDYAKRLRRERRETEAAIEATESARETIAEILRKDRERPVLEGTIKQGKGGRFRLYVRTRDGDNSLIVGSGANGRAERQHAVDDAILLDHARIHIKHE